METKVWMKVCIWILTVLPIAYSGETGNGAEMSLVITPAVPVQEGNGVEIRHLSVPHSIENGTVDYTDLDCVYTLRDNVTTLLVVKWYYSDLEEEKPVYKWIPEHDVRAAYGILENRIDFNHAVSTVPWEMYRGIRILNPTTEISGNYRCDVSTSDGHKTEGSLLIVYSKPKAYDLEVNRVENESISISCWASGTYPEAKLSVSYEHNKNRVKLTDMHEEYSHVAGAYDVKIFNSFNATLLPNSTKFFCDIRIPNTSYVEHKEVPFGIQDSGSKSLQYGFGLLLLLLPLLL